MDQASADYLWQQHHAVRTRVRSNRLYQQDRQRILEFRDSAIKALSILGGSVAFANVAAPEVVKACAIVITAGSTASLVFGFGAKARDAARRCSDWALLERDIEAVGERDYTEAKINEWKARCNDIEAGEPAPNTRLFERCHARALESLGATQDYTLSWADRNLPVLNLP